MTGMPGREIVQVAGLESLDRAQAELFANAPHPWPSDQDLAVYRMSDGKVVIAPANEALHPGLRVIGDRLAAVRFNGEAKIHVVDALVPFTE